MASQLPPMPGIPTPTAIQNLQAQQRRVVGAGAPPGQSPGQSYVPLTAPTSPVAVPPVAISPRLNTASVAMTPSQGISPPGVMPYPVAPTMQWVAVPRQPQVQTIQVPVAVPVPVQTPVASAAALPATAPESPAAAAAATSAQTPAATPSPEAAASSVTWAEAAAETAQASPAQPQAPPTHAEETGKKVTELLEKNPELDAKIQNLEQKFDLETLIEDPNSVANDILVKLNSSRRFRMIKPFLKRMGNFVIKLLPEEMKQPAQTGLNWLTGPVPQTRAAGQKTATGPRGLDTVDEQPSGLESVPSDPATAMADDVFAPAEPTTDTATTSQSSHKHPHEDAGAPEAATSEADPLQDLLSQMPSEEPPLAEESGGGGGRLKNMLSRRGGKSPKDSEVPASAMGDLESAMSL